MSAPDGAKPSKERKEKRGDAASAIVSKSNEGESPAAHTMPGQEEEETQLAETPVEEETQVVDEPMDEEGAQQPGEAEGDDGEDEDEPIEWPESPAREVLVS